MGLSLSRIFLFCYLVFWYNNMKRIIICFIIVEQDLNLVKELIAFHCDISL